jgi:flagellar hook-length control protein FliK
MCKRPLLEGVSQGLSDSQHHQAICVPTILIPPPPNHDFEPHGPKLVRNLLNTWPSKTNGKNWPPPFQQQTPLEKAQPMTITLSDNLSQASAAQNTGTLEFKLDANPSPDGQSFGQLMSDLIQAQTENSAEIADKDPQLAEQPGQEIAAPFTLTGLATVLGTSAAPLTAVTLKAVTLGPHLSVITPETSPPDSQSLEAFARAQGLDENAVHWLFGGHAGTLPNTLTTNPSVANVVTTDAALGSTESLGNFQGSPPAIQAAAAIGQVSPAANGQTTAAATGLLGPAMTAAQALWAMSDDTGQAKKPMAATTTEEVLPLQMLRMPPTAAVWMQRNVIQSVLQQAESAQKEADISLSELDLGADWGGETLQQLLGAEGGAHSTGTHGTAYANFASRWDAQAHHRNDPTNASGPAPDLPDPNARSENIQNLADKMGQAVGQRILSEMERGQWHLKLQLRPATLGHIEIEMRMRSGEFDAVFTAPNATTRDLLQDGMAKLRETLSQMGMDVANIHVGGGQTGQSGGDPTPGFSKGTPTQAKESGQETTPEIARAPRVKDPNDGLDVLV